MSGVFRACKTRTLTISTGFILLPISGSHVDLVHDIIRDELTLDEKGWSTGN
jgi:hypothetical protein